MSYLVNVHELMNKPGAMKEHRLDFVASDRIGTDVAAVSEGASLAMELRLESVHEGILATGVISATADSQCSRCLDPLKLEIEVDFQELFAYSSTSDDELAVVGEQIDLEQVVIDSVVLNLPFQPVCSEDCLGLCPECGFEMSQNPNHEHQAKVDPRFGALESLLKEEE